MQNGDNCLPTIIMTNQGILVKMLITLELHVISQSHFASLIHFNIMCVLIGAYVLITSNTVLISQNASTFKRVRKSLNDSILNETSNAKYYRSKDVLLILLYRSEIIADIDQVIVIPWVVRLYV